MFKSRQHLQSTQPRPDATFAGSTVVVLPGVALPPWLMTVEAAPQAAPVVTEPTDPTRSAALDPPAGWYADPSGRFALRWWDGDAWTEHTA